MLLFFADLLAHHAKAPLALLIRPDSVVQFGPAKVAFNANVMLALDAANKSGSVTARGKDTKGGTKFRTTMHFKVEGQDAQPQSVVPIKAEVDISGRLASMIETGASLVIKQESIDTTKEFSTEQIFVTPSDNRLWSEDVWMRFKKIPEKRLLGK